MTEIDRIIPGQVFRAAIADAKGASVVLKVQIVPGDGRVLISPFRQRNRPILLSEDILRNGGEVDAQGRLGRLIFPLQIGENLDTKV